MTRRSPLPAHSIRYPLPVAKILGGFLERTKLDVLPHTLELRWPELVSERIAANCYPLRLNDGILTVCVTDSTWLQQLSFLRQTLVAEINARYGKDIVHTIRLQTGAARPRRPLPAAPIAAPVAPEPTREQREVLQAEADGTIPLNLDTELRQHIVRARHAQLLRQRR